MTHIPDKPGEKKVFEKPERLNYGDKKYTGPGESGYTVTLLESNDKLLASQGIQQRTIEINCGKETRKAVYVGYDLWKNHAGAPVEHVTTILRLMADARRNNPETVSVINCAMGVGRSGTVAILDWLTRVVKQDSAWYFEPTDNSILKDEFLQNAFKENESIKKLATDDPILAMILYFRKYRRVIDAPAQIGTMRKYMYQLYMDC
ncbi:Tyrosine-protein phosphatase 1 [Penicillium alfredii]|uniref:Tyrosine-protein phosphatase 1 n=1 Tax=Penicillium alfredii TaxID=1506179 RepID=A0A9W9FJW9_9EURO|nr:Tyrosine-protein phosphatase 1 [Penicillium alfredii]KAJ5101574.1 Tyrosine-protein phosphatase 1 [Penicillium alfredii]